MTTNARLKSFKTPRPEPGAWARKTHGGLDPEQFELSPLTGIDFETLDTVNIPERPVVLERNGEPLFRYGHIVQIFAERGLGKSLFTTTLALVMAGRAESIGFSAPRSSRVLLIDGEMSSHELKSRQAALAKPLAFAGTPWMITVAADWQEDPMPRLDTAEGQAAIDPYIEWADVVVIDNRSCLFNAAGERDPIVWADAQRWILDLRRREKLVILVHHAGKNGLSRGISNVEDIIDFSVELTRPVDYDPTQGARFRMAFTKNRGVHGAAVEAATYALTPSEWVVESGASGPMLSQLERRILGTVAAGSFKTKTAIHDTVGGSTKRFYEAFERLEEKGAVRQTEQATKTGLTSRSEKFWRVNREFAKELPISEGSE